MEATGLTFGEAVATQPAWIRLWVLWLNVVTIGTFLVLLVRRRTWIEAGVLFAVTAAMVAVMMELYAAVGFVRLLGLPHLVFWIPLVVWLLRRLRAPTPPPTPQRQALWLLVGSYVVSLGFDLADVIRYALGERGSLVPTEAALPIAPVIG